MNRYAASASSQPITYGRFLSVDPLWGKYLPLQSYQYAANNPVMMLDRGGDSIIVLQDWEGAGGFGHTAVLIGGDDTGWHLFSKNGGSSYVAGESVNPDDWVYFKTLDEFKNKSTDNQLLGRYDNAFLIPTTKAEDTRAKAAASEAANSNYGIFGASCIDVVSDALTAAGKNPGTKTYVVPRTEQTAEGRPDTLPNVRVHDIKSKNDAKIVDQRVISPNRKDPEKRKN